MAMNFHLFRHYEMENDSSRLQNRQEPVVEKQANRTPVIVETSNSLTHHHKLRHRPSQCLQLPVLLRLFEATGTC